LHVLRYQTRFRWYQARLPLLSRFVLPYSFSTVSSASGPVFTFCALGHDWTVPTASGPFSRFALPDTFSAVPRASGPVFTFCAPGSFSEVQRASGTAFMFCAPGLVFGSTERVGPRFHVLRSRTRFWRFGTRRAPFTHLALPDTFSAVPSASSPVFTFAPRLHVLRYQTRFRRYRARRPPFSRYALPDPFSAVPSMSGPIFMFFAPGHIFVGTGRVEPHFHVLRSRRHFRRYRARRAPFSLFALPDTFSTVLSASGPVFTFCALGLVFGDKSFSGPIFTFCSPVIVFGSRFHVLRFRTRTRRY